MVFVAYNVPPHQIKINKNTTINLVAVFILCLVVSLLCVNCGKHLLKKHACLVFNSEVNRNRTCMNNREQLSSYSFDVALSSAPDHLCLVKIINPSAAHDFCRGVLYSVSVYFRGMLPMLPNQRQQ
jgi:hypothetical protein